jgi:hypothetical protein
MRINHVLASTHLVYVRIPGKGINHVLASTHLVYVRIPGKGINYVLPSIHLVYVRSRVRGSPCIDSYREMIITVKLVSVMC